MTHVLVWLWSAVVLTLGLGAALPAAARDLVSYAIVQDDGTLRLRGRTVRLFGIFIPDTGRQCRTTIRPPRCGLSRAALALDFTIQGFVRCRQVEAYADGSLGAFCFGGRSRSANGIDLGAFLVEEGLAVATPDAPFAYQALERIAREQGRGVWGLAVDTWR